MKLRCLYLDDAVVIPRSKDQGSGIPLTDTRDSSFHVDDGWDIRETLPGVFSITNDAMGERIVTIGGYGYSYEREPERLAKDKGSELPGVMNQDPASASPKERDTAAHVDVGDRPPPNDDEYEDVMAARSLQLANSPQALAAQAQQGRRRRR